MSRWRARFVVLVYIIIIELNICTASKFIFPEATRVDLSEPGIPGWSSSESAQIPYQLILRVVDRTGSVSSCAGSIIHPQFGLTAAHCIAKRHTIMIKAGCSNESRSALIFETQKYYIHPLFDEQNRHLVQPHDIGVINFMRKITFNSLVQPVRLQRVADMNKNYDGQRMIASGWSILYIDEPSEQMNWVYLRGISNSECVDVFGEDRLLIDSILCARWYNYTSQSSCVGNSGGPLTTYDQDGLLTQVGIAIFVFQVGCHTGLPAGFVRPGFYHDWLAAVTGHDFNWDPDVTPPKATTVEFVTPFVQARKPVTKPFTTLNVTTPSNNNKVKPAHPLLPNSLSKAPKKTTATIVPTMKFNLKKTSNKMTTIRSTTVTPRPSTTLASTNDNIDIDLEEYIANIVRDEISHASSTIKIDNYLTTAHSERQTNPTVETVSKEIDSLISTKHYDNVDSIVSQNEIQEEKDQKKLIESKKPHDENDIKKLLEEILEKKILPESTTTTTTQSYTENNDQKFLEAILEKKRLASASTTKQSFRENHIQKLLEILEKQPPSKTPTTDETDVTSREKGDDYLSLDYLSQLTPEKDKLKEGNHKTSGHNHTNIKLEELFQFAPVKDEPRHIAQEKSEYLENFELEKLVPDYVLTTNSPARKETTTITVEKTTPYHLEKRTPYHLEKTTTIHLEKTTPHDLEIDKTKPEGTARTTIKSQKLNAEILKSAIMRKNSFAKVVKEFMESIKIVPKKSVSDKSDSEEKSVSSKKDSSSSDESSGSPFESAVTDNMDKVDNITTSVVSADNIMEHRDQLLDDEKLLEKIMRRYRL